MLKLFYFIQYIDALDQHAEEQTTSSIICISRNQDIVENALAKAKSKADRLLGKSYSSVLTFETSNTPLTSNHVWILSKNDPDDPEFSGLLFVGNTFEDCLKWWNQNWKKQVYACKGDTPQFKVIEDDDGSPTKHYICRDVRLFSDSIYIEPFDLT